MVKAMLKSQLVDPTAQIPLSYLRTKIQDTKTTPGDSVFHTIVRNLDLQLLNELENYFDKRTFSACMETKNKSGFDPPWALIEKYFEKCPPDFIKGKIMNSREK
jgi:hypothetical protein